MNDNEHVYRPDFDPGDFRRAVARYVKLLIRSRWKCDPGFLTQAALASWNLSDIGRDRWPAVRLMEHAALALAHLSMHYLPCCGSGGVKETDESTPEGRLIQSVTGLAEVGDGGGPDHNGALRDACRRLRCGQPVDWDRLVAWDALEAIRSDLDRLPENDSDIASTADRLGRIEEMLASLVDRERAKEFYSVEEFARLVGKAEFTCREWCRHGRINASKKASGRGKHPGWAISHGELLRYRQHGLLPTSTLR